MENATKFLIIAAVILIVIVLIAIGVKVMAPAGQTAEQSDKTVTEVDGALDSATDAVGNAVTKIPTME